MDCMANWTNNTIHNCFYKQHIYGLGIMRAWKITMVKREKPRLANATPYLVTAFVLHAAYNSFCLLLSIADFQF